MATVEIENERGPLRSRVLSMRSRFDLVFDAVLLLSYGVAHTFRFTGIAIHEWFGLGFAVGLLGHLTLHWDWVKRTRGGFSPRLRDGE